MERSAREEYKTWKKGYYHMSLERLEGRRVFNSQEDYRMGMNSMALAKWKFAVEIYAFELMPNHLHCILSGTGRECVRLFSFIKRRFSDQLVKSGFPPLPDNYGFKLIPIEDEKAFLNELLYAARNPYEKDDCVPGGNPWGTGYLYFNGLAHHICGEKVGELAKAKVSELIGSRENLPPDWEIHPTLGILPRCYVKTEKAIRLFSSAKSFLTRLVKEYETLVKTARTHDEQLEFSAEEVQDIVDTELRNTYPGRLLKTLSQEEKCVTAVRLNSKMGLTPKQLAQALYISELAISQAIRSKDYGRRI